MKPWFLAAVGTFICWGLWGFIPKITVRYIDPNSAVIYEVIGGILFAIIALYILDFKIAINPQGISLAITTGLLGFAGALFFLYAVKTGPVTLIAPLTALYPVLAVLLAIIFLDETINMRQTIGISCALVAIFLMMPQK